MKKVVVTGMGIVSAIGNTVAENSDALRKGVCGIVKNSVSAPGYSHLPLASVSLSNDELRSSLKVDDESVTRTSLLALYAFREAISDAGLSEEDMSSSGTSLIGGTTIGGMCNSHELYRDVTLQFGDSPLLSSYDCASVYLFLQQTHRIGGITNTINTACSSAANAVLYGARLIRNGLAQKVIVGGADSLSTFTISGFNALRILSPEVCRPFDRDRQGVNLGEGAAFLVLEGADTLAPGKKNYGCLTGFCSTSDAFHPTSLSPEGEGPYLAIQGALRAAGLRPDEIGLINAHGTGTENNDESESRAMIRAFGVPPPFVSTKSNTGHALGAAAAIEAVYSLLNLTHQECYPSLHFSECMPDTQLRPVTTYYKSDFRHIMSNSFGFGGNCVSLVFSKS